MKQEKAGLFLADKKRSGSQVPEARERRQNQKMLPKKLLKTSQM